MAYDDDYRELIQSAHAALSDLLDSSTHDSWLELRSSYGSLRQALRRDDAARARDNEQRERESSKQDLECFRREFQERDQRQAAVWTRRPVAVRESLLLRVLGEDRLIIRELTSRLNAELGSAEKRLPTLYEGNVRRLVMRMLRTGQLEREPEAFKGKTRYRYYFRKSVLDGPIVELERAYHEDDGATGRVA